MTRQLVSPVPLAYGPGRHALHAAAPVDEEAKPAGQESQVEAPDALENFPDAQALQSAAPASEK